MIKLFQKLNFKKVFIFRFGAIGDVVHSTALFRAIKKVKPDIEIHYLTFKTPSELLKGDPDLDKLWICERKSYSYLLKLANILKKEEFDLIINLQPSIRTKIFAHFIGAKKILTYKKTFKLHAVENFLNTAIPAFKDIRPDNNLKLYISEETNEKIRKLVNADKMVIGFNVGANFTRQGRRWPIQNWVELAGLLIGKYSCDIIITGSEEDERQLKELAEVVGVRSFCGKLSLTESAAALSMCYVVVSGDTGPLHIATALGVPVVGLYGSMPISRTGPWEEKHFALTSDMECVPCNRRKCKYTKKDDLSTPCMEKLLPAQVLDAIDRSFNLNNDRKG